MIQTILAKITAFFVTVLAVFSPPLGAVDLTTFQDSKAETVAVTEKSQQDTAFLNKGEYKQVDCQNPEKSGKYEYCTTVYGGPQGKGWILHINDGAIKQDIDFGPEGRDSIEIIPPTEPKTASST